MSSKENPLVSIVIPCYNQKDYIKNTLDSVKKQIYQNWECIIVNDGSTDNSIEIIKECTKDDNRFKIINKCNEGVSVARNTAINVSKGEYILPLDGDDIITPSYISTAVSYFICNPKVKLVYCRAAFIGDREGEWQLPPYNFESLKWENSIFCSALFRRSDFEKSSGYNPNMKQGLEDWDFWLSFLNQKDEVYKIPEILFYYRKHGATRNCRAVNQANETYGQLVENHIHLYRPFLRTIFQYRQETKYYCDEIEKLKSSKSYRLGHAILWPFRFIKTKLKP